MAAGRIFKELIETRVREFILNHQRNPKWLSAVFSNILGGGGARWQLGRRPPKCVTRSRGARHRGGHGTRTQVAYNRSVFFYFTDGNWWLEAIVHEEEVRRDQNILE